MKRMYPFLLFLYLHCLANAQSINEVGKISIALEMPKSIDKLSAAHVSKLETKMMQLVTTGGLVAGSKYSPFVLKPSFIVQESSLVEGGMAKLTVITADLSLSIQQVGNNVLFSSTSKQLKGSGSTEAIAIGNAIGKIQPNDPSLKQFIEMGKSKILEYYESNCDLILSQSESLLLLQKYQDALTLLMSVPQEVKCSSSLQERALVAYGAWQNQQCSIQLQKAKAAIAGEKIGQAIEILSQVDPAASCFAETQHLLSGIKDKNPSLLTDWELHQKKNANPDTLKKVRMVAIKTIVVAPYVNPTTNNSNANQSDQGKSGQPISNPSTVEPVTSAENPSTTNRRYYALIMGVEKYDDPAITSLSEPIKDAGQLKQVLIDRYTFNEEDVTFLKNPTFEVINVAFEELSNKIGPSDFLLVFYAGHGYFDEKTNIGYWLPSDAQQKNRAKWFRNSALVENIRAINSKHTLLIADACFSGGIFKTRAPFNNASPDIADMLKRPSRKAMTSGSLTTVPDKSVFMKYLLKTLTENANQYLPSEDLFDEIRISMKSNADTKPLYGEIQNAGDEGGNFVLIRKK